ncbi:uncharacterized protein LOC135084734 [Ostrinia nubilalis]|uniref:uncharacterized protein LOC135084734 n=1 Tax=Ostrinia nubilalis TaxID=29057 RepID=UPI003082607D
MLKNKNYLYGPKDFSLPTNLNFGEFILGKLWEFKDRVALIDGTNHELYKYGQIAQEATNLAVSLYKLGVRKGETVAIISENRREFFSALIGSSCTGAVITTINLWYTKGEMNHILGISKPKYVFCSPQAFKTHEKTLRLNKNIQKIILFGADRFNDTLLFNDLCINDGKGSLTRDYSFEEIDVVHVDGQTDTLFILYSSGTTGLPKGVMLTHVNILGICLCGAMDFGTGIIMGIGPWFHAMGLVGTLAILSRGLTYAFLVKFDVDSLLKAVEKYKVEMLSLVPAVLMAILKIPTQYDLSSVRRIVVGAAPAHADTIRDFLARYPNISGIVQAYGMTESSLAITRNMFDDDRTPPASVGQVLNNTVLKIVDPETRTPLGPNQTGEICVKGSMIMKGYVGKNRADDFDDEGFLMTGDVGYYDEQGFVYVVDRLKEFIKYKANQVAPVEIEALLLQHEAVREAGVVGVADKEAGELPMAFISTQPGKSVTEKEIQEFVAQRLSNPKHLRGGVRFVDEIPKNPTGKILRKVLRSMANNGKSKL